MSLETPKERAQKELERQELLASVVLRDAYRKTFDTEYGRLVLEDFIVKGHMLETTCSGNAWSYFYEGERNWNLRMMALIPDLFGEVVSDILSRRQGEISKTLSDLAREE